MCDINLGTRSKFDKVFGRLEGVFDLGTDEFGRSAVRSIGDGERVGLKSFQG
jgi:hypothetical protein